MVITILVTLVAGVIPLVSPNNDARKIREASRGLQAYINATQAEAARTGRPHGIGFVENPSGDGMALEVFRMEVPPAFAGFSEASRVEIRLDGGLYGPNGNKKGTQFLPRYFDYPLYNLQFVLVGGSAGQIPDPLPPRMFRIGDRIDVDGNQFLIVDDDDPKTAPNKLEIFPNSSVQFLASSTPQIVQCIWLNNHGQQLPQQLPPKPPITKPYRIIRQPVTSSASPFVFPSGVGIDLQGSVQEGGATLGLPVPNSFATPRMTTGTNPQPLPDSVSIMFSPNGHVSSFLHNGNQITSATRIVLLLGRAENGDLAYEPDKATSSGDVTSGAWTMNSSDTNEQLTQQQTVINWLNLDSRLIGISVRSGRVIVNGVAFVDARLFGGKPPADQAAAQIEAAHDLAHSMKRGGGR